MNQLSVIKERIKNMNDSEFQELCDSFLKLRNLNYKVFSRSGAHDTKQKTIRGVPDSFFQLPNGSYLFVESTTIEHKGKGLINKLKVDIQSCLDINKTGIPSDKIQEIVLCYTSNLKAHEVEIVNERALEIMGTPPLHLGLDVLASEIFFHHKNLAHDYLGLPLDTGQVISIEKFVEEYDNGKQKLATPLGVGFVDRGDKLNEILDILENQDIVIISGSAGVGKTKLALESIKRFISSHIDYNSFAIAPKGADLIGDLSAYFDVNQNSLLLIDDVNRVDKFEQILGFYNHLNLGKLKLILTVRDYALQNVREQLFSHRNSIVSVEELDFEGIKKILAQEPFKILHGSYLVKINSIARGNARLAVMMAIIARRTNSLDSLNNVSDVFEQYFETFVSDEAAFKDSNILKALGILSFFFHLPYNNEELITSITKTFPLSFDTLVLAFDKLHSLDLVEVNYQHVRFGEQNFSTYLFYKIFIKDELLSFELLWNTFYENYQKRFKDTIYPAYQNFGKQFVVQKIKPTLRSHWYSINHERERALNFLNFAWQFLPDECLDFIDTSIESMENSAIVELKTNYERNDFSSSHKQERYLVLLSNYFNDTYYISDVLDLSFRFVAKNPSKLSELIYLVDHKFNFVHDDFVEHFERQSILIDFLVDKLEKGELYVLSFLAIAQKLLDRLRWKYDSEKESEEDDLNISSAKQSRGKILRALCELPNDYHADVLQLMMNFSIGKENDGRYSKEFDLEYLIPWIDINLDTANFRHCFFVQELTRSAIRAGCENNDFERLKLTYFHRTYDLLEIINWDRRRGRDQFDFENYKEFDSLKFEDISNKLTFEDQSEVELFLGQYEEILIWDYLQLNSQYRVLDAIISSNLSRNKEIGYYIFVELVKLHDRLKPRKSDFFFSYSSIDLLVSDMELANRFWLEIDSSNLDELWKFDVICSLPDNAVTKSHLTRFYNFVQHAKVSFRISLKRIIKFERIDKEFIMNLLLLIVQKIKTENHTISLDSQFFTYACTVIGDFDLIREAYFLQEEREDIFDYEGDGLYAMLQRNKEFLLEYIKRIFHSNRQDRSKEHGEFRVIWKLSDTEEILNEVMEYMATVRESFYFKEHFANSLFGNTIQAKERIEDYLLSLIDNYSDRHDVMNIVFDVIKNSKPYMFENAFKSYVRKNQKVEDFKRINWLVDQVLYSGGDIVSEITASKWEKLLFYINSIEGSRNTTSIKRFIRGKINSCMERAEYEKMRSFMKSY